jgi:hypothetical protein
MLKPFEVAAAALAAVGPRLPDASGDEVVFVGEAIAVKCVSVGTCYRRRHQHVSVQTLVVPCRSSRAQSAALQMARESAADLLAAVEMLPRSDRQAADILVRAAELDHVVAGLLPTAKVVIKGGVVDMSPIPIVHARVTLGSSRRLTSRVST